MCLLHVLHACRIIWKARLASSVKEHEKPRWLLDSNNSEASLSASQIGFLNAIKKPTWASVLKPIHWLASLDKPPWLLEEMKQNTRACKWLRGRQAWVLTEADKQRLCKGFAGVQVFLLVGFRDSGVYRGSKGF